MSSVVLKMGVWCVVILCVISSVVANVHDPVNPPYLIEEVKATAESRVLERVEKLLQTLSDKIKVFHDGIDGMKRDINSLHLARNESIKSLEDVTKQLQNLSTRNMNMEQKLEPLPKIIRDISGQFVVQKEMQEMLQTTNKTFSQRVVHLEQKLEPLSQIIRDTNEMIKTTNKSFTQRVVNLERKLEPLPQIIRDISFHFLVQREMQEMLKTTNKAFTQRMVNVEHKLEPLTQIIRVQKEIQEMFKTTNKSFSQRLINLQHSMQRLPGDSGVYLLQPDPSNNIRFEVFRDWTNNHGFGGGWVVFQRRINGSVNFYRNWTEYKDGFGNLNGEHWLGLDKLHTIVETLRHELLIVLEDFDGVIAYAHYDDFQIGDESEKYILKSVGNYSGTAGDSFTVHKGYQFSTYDHYNYDLHVTCSERHKGAWWFSNRLFCLYSHLNGPYLKGKTVHRDVGVTWYSFRGSLYSMKSSKMMVRPIA